MAIRFGRPLGLAAILLGAGLAGCRPQDTPPATGAASPTARQPVISTLPPAADVASPATPPGECTNQARFLDDLTVPDGSRIRAGETIDKRWSVQNSGSCDWGPGYRLVRTDNGSFSGPAEIALYPARAGQTATLQVLLTAPSAPGPHIASYQPRSPAGEFFGDPVFVLVEVGP